MDELVLITREGCCLCEGLEEKLLELALPFSRLDVDADPRLRARFDLEVPVLLVREAGEERQLPRVSPRLPAAQLRAWLQGHGVA